MAAGLALGGARLPLPARPARPGKAVTVFLLVAWALALVAWGVAVALVVFFIIMVRGPSTFWAKVVSAITAAAAGPVIFELPFDFIVMGRVYPPIPPHPDVYRALFFIPFFVLLVLTLSLLTLSPMMQLARPTFYCFALMLLVFAVWALIGFGYPSAPGPIVLNIAGKLLAFVTALTLFWPQRTRDNVPASAPAPGASRAEPAPDRGATGSGWSSAG